MNSRYIIISDHFVLLSFNNRVVLFTLIFFHAVLHDYCQTEYFQPECPPGKIVVVEEARFGRIELGTCLTADFGYLDCYR